MFGDGFKFTEEEKIKFLENHEKIRKEMYPNYKPKKTKNKSNDISTTKKVKICTEPIGDIILDPHYYD